MLMIDYLSWLCMAFTVIQLWLLSEMRYKVGWYMGIVSGCSWGVYAIGTDQWAVLCLQVFLIGNAFYALKKIADVSESSGLPRRGVVNSKNQKEKTACKNSNRGDDHDPISGEMYTDF